MIEGNLCTEVGMVVLDTLAIVEQVRVELNNNFKVRVQIFLL